jgi:hypothetical protein
MNADETPIIGLYFRVSLAWILAAEITSESL